MKAGARAQTAVEILEELAARGTPADRLLSGYFRKRRFIGSKDRRAISDMVYGELRARAALGWHLAQAGLNLTPRSRIVAWLATEGGWSVGEIAEAFDGGQYRPAPLTEKEAEFVRTRAGKPLRPPEMPEAARANCPEWLAPDLKSAFGDAFAPALEALNRPAALDLRVNTLKATREEAKSMLAADGVDAVATPYSPWGLRIAGRVNLAGTRAWQDGLIDVQDEASQLAALLTGVQPGATVLDICAGAGGKTLAMAAMMENEGRIFACDAEPARMTPIAARAARAGVQIIELDPMWHAEENKGESKVKGQEFETVLIDAPCSGTGSWRRNPDARWRLSDENVVLYAKQQYGILRNSAKLVQCGGHLVYVTCSVLPQENEVQIKTFLEQCSGFRAAPIEARWAELVATDFPGEDPWLHLTPHEHGTDGFFVAVLERTA